MKIGIIVSRSTRIKSVSYASRIISTTAARRTASILTMSTSTPVRLEDVMRDATVDTRGLNLAPALDEVGDSVATISSVTVARVDKLPVTAIDLSISPVGYVTPWISANADGLLASAINWWQGVGAGATIDGDVDYRITVAFVTTGGRNLRYDALQLVSATVG